MWEIIRQKTDIRVKFNLLLSFSKSLLSIYYAPSTIVGYDNTAVTKRFTSLSLMRLDSGERDKYVKWNIQHIKPWCML